MNQNLRDFLCLLIIALVLTAVLIGLDSFTRFLSHQWKLMRVRWLIILDDKHPNLPENGTWIGLPSHKGQRSCRLIAGVWVDIRLYYEALKMPMGVRPPGDDVEDRDPGIPESVFGKCERCKRSWKWVEGHTTNYANGSGMFPLCERCWKELSPTERLPYYRTLWDRWRTNDPVWEQVEAAVLEGK